jgi:hypothetical protein
MATFERPLIIGKIDNFTFTLSSRYLVSEIIISATVTTTSGNLTIDAVSNDGVVISALCTGVAEGNAVLEYNWLLTSGRSKCEKVTVIVEAC